MNRFEHALEGALALINEGRSPEEALLAYPQHAERLRPLLAGAAQVRKLQEITPSAEFRERNRRLLQAYAGMQQAPPRARRPSLRLATALATVMLALTAGTAMAQGAMPGSPLHPLKLASEQAWRAVQADPLQVDLLISERRLQELLAVEGDPQRVPAALSAYAAALDVLRRDLEAQPARALSAQAVVRAQTQQVQGLLEASGSTVDEFFTILPSLDKVIANTPEQLPLDAPVDHVQLVAPVIPSVSIPMPQSGRENTGTITIGKDEISIEITLPLDLVEKLLRGLSISGSSK